MNAVEPADDAGLESCSRAEGGGRSAAARRWTFWAISAAVFTLLTGVLFWRYALAPATTVSDAGDPIFLMWTMGWVQRALLHAPSDLFDAPQFHPFAATLAYSDPLLPQSVVTLPLRGLGAGPVLAYNAVYLGGIVASGVIAAALFRRLTVNRLAALAGAIIATFPALRLFHLAHMQIQVTTLLPLACLLVHRVVDAPSRRGAVALALTLVAAALGSLYHGMFLAILLPPFALTVWLCRRRRTWDALLALGAAAALAGVVLLPFGVAYARAIEHIALPRTNPHFSDLSDYLATSPFADVGVWLPSLVVRDRGPQWVGAAGAWWLPVAAGVVAVRVVQSAVARRGAPVLPDWVRAALPYVVLGCAALCLSLGPEVRWRGHVLFANPIGHLSSLPGVRNIRDFQRAGFLVALAGGALVALALAELARRGHRLVLAASLGAVVLSTVAPAFSSSLPAHRPRPRDELPPVYEWLARQEEPLVLFEAPLPRRGESEPLDYLWAAIHHEKQLVHGFSGFLPLTDGALRGESALLHRRDFFNALSLLGATHLVVHTAALNAVPGGAAALLALREAREDARVARFPDAEVYRVDAGDIPEPTRPGRDAGRPAWEGGGRPESRGRCFEIDSSSPLTWFFPEVARVTAVRFVAETALGELDEALSIAHSDHLGVFRAAPHQPLLSSTLADYLEQPAERLRTRAAVADAFGPFLRLSSRTASRIRLCDVAVEGETLGPVVAVPRDTLRVEAQPHAELADLAIDGKLETRWHSGATQRGAEWFDVTLPAARDVVAVVLELGDFAFDHGRRLAVECDGSERSAREGGVAGERALLERPRPAQILAMQQGSRCRRLRILQTGVAPENYWSIAEVSVLAREEKPPG